MSAKLPRKKLQDYEIPCQLLPETEFDMSGAIPPSQRLHSSIADLVRDAQLYGRTDLDFAQEDNGRQKKGKHGKGKAKKDR